GSDRLHGPGIVEVLEEILPRQVAAMPHDAREPRIVDRDAVELAALAAELELEARALYADVAIAHRGEPERIVLLGISLVAHANAGALEQLHDRRQYLAARKAGNRRIRARAAPDARQRRGESGQAIELVRIARLAPARVVAILLAPARIAPRRLQVS